MNQNQKPQANYLGQQIDDQSIKSNVTDIYSLSAKYNYTFGKSSPIITDYDLAERALFPDANFCNSYSDAESHLREQGLIPAWSRESNLRFRRPDLMTTSKYVCLTIMKNTFFATV